MQFSRRQFLATAAAAAATTAIPSWASAGKKVRIAVGCNVLYYYISLTIAERLGYYTSEGLDCQIIDFQGGSKSLQAVIGGSAEIVSGAFEHTISMQSKNQKMRAFVLEGRAPQCVFAVSNKTMPNYSKITDLKGKKIGVSAPGSSSQALSNFVLVQGGVQPSEVSYIGVGVGAGAVAAMRSGQIDAFVNLDPVIATCEQDHLLRIIADTRKIEESDKIFGGPFVAGCLYAKDDYIQQNADIIQGLTNAIVRADKWLAKCSVEEFMKVVPPSYYMGNPAIYQEGFEKNRPALSKDGLFPQGCPEMAFKVLANVNKQIAAFKPDFAATFTNQFAEEANKKYPA